MGLPRESFYASLRARAFAPFQDSVFFPYNISNCLARLLTAAGLRLHGEMSPRVRIRLIDPLVALATMLVCSLAVFGQNHEKPKAANSEHTYSARDLSGVWMERQNSIEFSSEQPPMQVWAEAKFKSAKPGYGPYATSDSQDPILKCLPPGVPRILLIPFPMQVVQIPGQIVMLFEYDHFVRQIYMDRRQHPRDLDPTWMGDSIGKWEGDTLVVDTVGLNDRTWLDQVGHPHSDALHVVERIRRADYNTLVDDITVDDPKAYTHPWKGQQVFQLRPSWRLMEYVCEDSMPEPRK